MNAGKILSQFAGKVSPEAAVVASALQSFVTSIDALVTRKEANTLEYYFSLSFLY